MQQITILAAAECATHIAGFPTLDQVVSSDINTFHGLYQIRNIPLGWQHKTQLPLLVNVAKMSFTGLLSR